MVSECVLVQTIAFVSGDLQLGALTCQCLDSGKTDTSPSSSPLKSLNIRRVFQSSLSLLKENPGIWNFSPLRNDVSGEGALVSECYRISYWLLCSQFQACL